MFRNDKYVILHIPKTAGTSLHVVLIELFKKKNVSPLFGAPKLSKSQARKLGKNRMVCGHISWADVIEYYSDRKTITFLREPIDRCVSWYYYVKSRNLENVIPLNDIKYVNAPAEAISLAKHLDIDDFFQHEHPHIIQNINNRQVWQIGDHADIENRSVPESEILDKALLNMDKIDFVGFSESFTQDISLMCVEFGLGEINKVPFVNRSNNRLSVKELTPQTRNKLAELNELDLVFYEKARNKSKLNS